jgi:hypothetical protein
MGGTSVLIAASIALVALLLTATAPTVTAQGASSSREPCGFIDGFRAFRGAAGTELVGDCLEHSRATAGGVEQRTTNGLLVWDKTLNVVAFTDGHQTWVSGPNGIETRPNTERLAWEEEALRAAKAEAAARAEALRAPSPRELALLYVERVRGNNAVSLEKIYLTAYYQAQHGVQTWLSGARTALADALAGAPAALDRAHNGASERLIGWFSPAIQALRSPSGAKRSV